MTNSLISGASTPSDPQWLGIYNAKVVNSNDPLNQGRVQLQVPQVLGNAISNWATPMQPSIVPAVGTNCYCVFLGGNPNLPQFFVGLSNETVANIQSVSSVLNQNPMFLGGVITPWQSTGCLATATNPNPDNNPPFPNGCLMTATNTVMYIEDAFFDAVSNVPYGLTAWVFSPAGDNIFAGFIFEDNGGNLVGNDLSLTTTTAVPAGQWTYISTVITSPANITMGTPIIGSQDATVGELLIVEAVIATGQIPGGLIAPGSIGVGQISFTAPDIGAIQVFIENTQPVNPNMNDIWFDAGNDNQMLQWNGTNWLPFQWGSSAFASQSIVSGIVAEGAIDGLVINGITINGNTITAADVIVSNTAGGLFVYTQGGGQVQTLTSGTSWVAPTGITSVKVECVGGGGGGGTTANANGGGGGGGEYAQEPIVAVTPGNTYTYAIGAGGAAGNHAGGTTTFTGDAAVTITAHGGGGSNGTAAGAGGTGSTNSTHHNGGAGGTGTSGSVPGSVDFETVGSGHWVAPAGVTAIKAECWGGGGGGRGGNFDFVGGPDRPGTGGGGGEYAAEPALVVTPGHSYSYFVASGGAGGAAGVNGATGGFTSFVGDAKTVGGNPGSGGNSSAGGGGGTSSNNTTHHNGGAGGGTNTSIPNGSGGGGSAGSTGTGGNGSLGNGSIGGSGGAGGSGGGVVGGRGGYGSGKGSQGGYPGGGGGGGEGWSGGVTTAGGAGGNGLIKLSWTAFNYQGAGGGSSGGSGSAGNPGGTEQGGVAPAGGGPGGGVLSNGVWTAAPANGPGGGGGGQDPGGSAGAGAAGQITLTYSSGSPALLFSVCGAPQTDPIASTSCPEGPCLFLDNPFSFVGTAGENTHGTILAPAARQLQLAAPMTAGSDNQAQILLTSHATGGAATLTMTGTVTGPSSIITIVDGSTWDTGGINLASGSYVTTASAWTSVTPGSGWALGSGNGSSPQNLQYRISADNLVQLRGVLHSTSSSPSGTMFTLPAGFRPATLQWLNVTEATNTAAFPNFVGILTSGAAQPFILTTAANTDYIFDSDFRLT